MQNILKVLAAVALCLWLPVGSTTAQAAYALEKAQAAPHKHAAKKHTHQNHAASSKKTKKQGHKKSQAKTRTVKAATHRPERIIAGPAVVAPIPGLAAAPLTAETFSPKVASGDSGRRPNVRLGSRSVLVVRADNGEVLYRKNIDREMPIASITKLMTAMVVLDAGQSLDEEMTVDEADVDAIKHTHSRLAVGTRLTRGEFMLLALMSSENRAAAALARNYPGGKTAAVAAMNRKAHELGMTNAQFVDGTGLLSDNRASPVDLVRMVKAAQAYDAIRKYSTTTQYTVAVRQRAQTFRNTNPLVKNPDWSIDLTKTGFINEAGRCLVMQAHIAEMPVILVLMDSQGLKTRIADAVRVRKWLETSIRIGSTGVRKVAVGNHDA